MQFGMPTLIETETLEDCVALCKELQLDFIELNMGLPQYQTHNIDVSRFSEIAKSNGIYYTIHLADNFDVCDFNKQVANAHLSTILQLLELAKKLNIPTINMHPIRGVGFTLPTGKSYLYEKYIDIYLDSLKNFRDKCEKAIGNSNIKICIENLHGFSTGYMRKGLELLLESNAFALTYDIGHNHQIGGSDEAVIMQHEDRLRHMHVHDVLGTKSHLALGTGEIDLAKYFGLAKKNNCRVVLETKTIEGLRQSVGYVNTFAR